MVLYCRCTSHDSPFTRALHRWFPNRVSMWDSRIATDVWVQATRQALRQTTEVLDKIVIWEFVIRVSWAGSNELCCQAFSCWRNMLNTACGGQAVQHSAAAYTRGFALDIPEWVIVIPPTEWARIIISAMNIKYIQREYFPLRNFESVKENWDQHLPTISKARWGCAYKWDKISSDEPSFQC